MSAQPCHFRLGDTDKPMGLTHPCGKPSVYRYPAMGGGFAYLCEKHGAHLADSCEHITRGFGKHVADATHPARGNWPRWESP